MAFNEIDLISSPIARVRLMVGDIDHYEILKDSVYEYFILNTNTEVDAAIEAMESIVNYYSFNADEEKIGSRTMKINIRAMERRLDDLKEKRASGDIINGGQSKLPVMVRSDRKTWKDFNRIFGDED